ncbi:MAG: ROK family protein [candidate division Zixibacteria bacterium]|nr:ROK family protein [candidate division Zixibacteria bacterium]
MQSGDPIALGVDIGGTFIKSALVNSRDGTLASDVLKVDTPANAPPLSLIHCVAELLRRFQWGGAVGIGFPGVVDRSIVRTAVHLRSDWIGINIIELCRQLRCSTCQVVNDADAAGIAEMTFGAGKQRQAGKGDVILLVTLGTGIGSALFVSGQLVPNTEFGHIYTEDGVEAEALAAASLRERSNMSWEEWGGRVSQYLRLVRRIAQPDLIILGGGVIENWNRFAMYLPSEVRVVPAVLGNHAGLIGAACRAIISA